MIQTVVLSAMIISFGGRVNFNMTYKSNIPKVLNKLKSKISAAAMSDMYQEIAQSIFASNLVRIHSHGKAVNESGIGHYAESTKRFRIKKHREISFVDLEVSGRLRLSWKMLKQGSGYVIGFSSKYGADISGYMEDHFKKQIWGVTSEDKKVSQNIVKRYFHAI